MNKHPVYRISSLSLILLLFFISAKAQDSTAGTVTIVAGPQYYKGGFYQKLWGKHYRTEWSTPVNVPVLRLDEAGLKPYARGDARQSKSLRLRDAQGKEYVLRSIDKNFGRALPPIYQKTFIEKIINDQVSTAHPYAAVTIPGMAKAAGIYYTEPKIVFLPQQPALDTFNQVFGNIPYLLEQLPEENREGSINPGASPDIINTELLFRKIYSDPHHRVDQLAYVRARLFDMFIGDWGRHEDQWRWTSSKEGAITYYKPIPRDRDQAYTKFDGVILGFTLSAASLGHLESFRPDIEDVESFSFSARNLDRQMANAVTLEQWTSIANDLQSSLTDEIIESSVRRLPPEVFSISGNTIITNLKGRRDHLPEYAAKYYRFLAKEVEVAGTAASEYIGLRSQNGDSLVLLMYRVDSAGVKEAQPYYQRSFNRRETDELRIYGIDGKDVFEVDAAAGDDIKIRLIGGPDSDDFRIPDGRGKIHIYDNHFNSFSESGAVRTHLSSDPAVHRFEYNTFRYDKKGIKPAIFYDSDDRLFVGLGYRWQKQRWRKEPFGYEHGIHARYSLSQRGFNFLYEGQINEFIGKWNLGLSADYDLVKWTNFFGIGNETTALPVDMDFYRMRTKDFTGSLLLSNYLGDNGILSFSGFYQRVKIINDTSRFAVKTLGATDNFLEPTQFSGVRMDLSVNSTDNRMLPTKGFRLLAGTGYTMDITNPARSFASASGRFDVFLPLPKSFILGVRVGGESAWGNPVFYQLPSIGGSQTLRGFRRDRFYGKSTFYNTNDLQWVFNMRSHLMNGKAGLVAHFDQARVWMPDEKSDRWHRGMGAGILLAPFNKLLVTITYSRSKELGIFQLRYTAAL
jgi:hypothetical protein